MWKRFYLLLSVLLASLPALGQTSSLHGQVTDESGAVVPFATVILNGPYGLVKTTRAGNDGSYAFADLAPGNYTVQASAPDLKLPQAAKIALKAGSQTLTLQLHVAATMQEVKVEDNAGPAVSTEAANNAGAGSGGGGIFSESANNRRLELQTRFTF